jgi:PAS domain S-box-containing protein
MHPRLPPARAIAALTAVTVALIAMSVALLLWQMRRHALQDARVQTAGFAHMFREQTERTFEGADQVLRAVQERMQTSFGEQLPLDGPAVHLLLGSRALGAPHVDLVAIADAQGRIVNASRDDPLLAASIAGTGYFKALANGAEGLRVGGPARAGRDAWTLDLARPLTDSHGRFRGVVVLTMPVPQLEDFYSWMQLDYQRPVALYLLDGTLLARAPARDSMVGERPPELGHGPLPADGGVHMLSHVGGDGATHDFAIARAGAFPLLVGVKADEEPALAAWREQAVPIALGALLVCLFTIGAAGALSAHVKREARLSRELEDANDRYQRTVDSLMDAIVGVDEAHHITMFNPAAERMFGLRASDAIGGAVTRLIPPRLRSGHAGHMRRFFSSAGDSRGMAPGMDVLGLRADGTEFPVESTIARTEFGGKVEVTAVLRDVTQRRRAEQELRDTNRQLRALAAALQDVREQERTRIAAELHDELGQQLTGLKLELSWLAARVKDGRALAAEHVDGMRQQLDASIASVRRIATDLRPRVLDDLGFGEAVAWQASEFARRIGLAIDLDLEAADLVRDPATATALFRIVQESLTNIVRHAHANSVTVTLEAEDDELVLRIEDDGRGFDAAGSTPGIGVVGMRERALAVGARLAIDSVPGQGTTIEVRLPLQQPVEAEAVS